MRFLALLALALASFQTSGCASTHISLAQQRKPDYTLFQRSAHSARAHASREFSVQFSRSLP